MKALQSTTTSIRETMITFSAKTWTFQSAYKSGENKH